MSVFNIFTQDAFSMQSLTEGINKIPFKPQRVLDMGIFQSKPIDTTTVVVEERHGKLSVIPVSARSTMPTYDTDPRRQVRTFQVHHIPKNDAIMADDLQNVRAFGTQEQLEVVSSKVAEKLLSLREDHDLTWEWHAIKALTEGKIYDADGTTVLNDWYSEFGVTQDLLTISEANINDPKLKLNEARRLIRKALGGDRVERLHCFMGEEFSDRFTTHSGVKEAYDRWQEGSFLRDSQVDETFNLFKVNFEEYEGEIGSQQFVDDGAGNTDVAYVFAMGTRNAFKRYNCPSPFLDAVNRPGKPLYAKQIRDEWDTMVKIHTSSNPLFINTRPKAVVRLRITA